MPTSATGVTPVITGGVRLLVEFGSLVGELILAALVSEPLAGAVTTTVRLLIWPLFFNDTANTDIYPLSLPVALPISKVTDAGKVSVTTTLLATDGPKLVTEIV